jgi:hypothetical protein
MDLNASFSARNSSVHTRGTSFHSRARFTLPQRPVPVRNVLFNLLNVQRVTVALVGAAAFLFLLTTVSDAWASLPEGDVPPESASAHFLVTINSIPAQVARVLEAAGWSIDEADLAEVDEDDSTTATQNRDGNTPPRSLRPRFKNLGGFNGKRVSVAAAAQKPQAQTTAMPRVGTTSPASTSLAGRSMNESTGEGAGEKGSQGSSAHSKQETEASSLRTTSKTVRSDGRGEINGENKEQEMGQSCPLHESSVMQILSTDSDATMHCGIPNTSLFPWISSSGPIQALEMDGLGSLAFNSVAGSLKGTLS